MVLIILSNIRINTILVINLTTYLDMYNNFCIQKSID